MMRLPTVSGHRSGGTEVFSPQVMPEQQTAGNHSAKTGQCNERIRLQDTLEVIKCLPGLLSVSARYLRKGMDWEIGDDQILMMMKRRNTLNTCLTHKDRIT